MRRMSQSDVADDLLRAAHVLVEDLTELQFAEPVACVYNPLVYAGALHEQYVRRYAPERCKAVFLGMNPGPWGMAQTGIPFGEIPAVRDWMGLQGEVGKPETEHPKRPVEGLDCTRSEVSGRRLWGLFAETYGTARQFFSEFFVLNYCPLVFMTETGANLTPDKLPAAEREPLETCCDLHLAKALEALNPQHVIGIGGFASKRAQKAVAAYDLDLSVGTLLHPSPASPIANREWPQRPLEQLKQLALC